MNAEFEALKNLVPACNGVEMHKLAILQASIEYVRYLEGCVQELQSGGRACSAPPPVFSTMAEEDEEEEEEDEEMEMEPTEDTSRRNSSFEQQQQQQLSERSSPVSQLQQTLPAPPHRNSYPDEYPSYTTTPSSAASPAFSAINSATTSPIFTFPSNSSLRLPSISPLLFPQHYTNENSPGALEATGAGALLLLADEGRRESYTASSWNSIQSVASRPRTGSVSTRGMNVRDLLSS